MNNKCFILLAITVLMSLTLLSPLSFADDHTKEVLSETWSMTPKEGMAGDMQDGMTKHGKFRDTLKETREWRMYTPVLGNRLDTLAVRSFGFGWEDLDKFREWSAKNDSQKNFNENVDGNVNRPGLLQHSRGRVSDQRNRFRITPFFRVSPFCTQSGWVTRERRHVRKVLGNGRR